MEMPGQNRARRREEGVFDFESRDISQTSEFSFVYVVGVSTIIIIINHFAIHLAKEDCKLLNLELILVTNLFASYMKKEM